MSTMTKSTQKSAHNNKGNRTMAINRKVASKVTVGKGTKGKVKKSSAKTGLWAKIKAIPTPIMIGFWLVVFGAIGTKMLFFSGATAFQYVGTHPQAVTQPDTSTGRRLTSLAAWNGKIYAGYGDWNANTGPMSVTPFDPATNTFASTPEFTADAEQVAIWKTINNKLFAVHIDPRASAPYSVADASSGKVVWANSPKPFLTHIFGLAEGSSPSELFLVGSLDEGSAYNEVAKVFRSTDGGATWSESFSVPSRGGFNRMMFVANLNNTIYVQNYSTADFSGSSVQSAAWSYSNGTWSKATPIAQTYSPFNGTTFAGKILAQSGTYGGSLLAYDGRSTTSVRTNISDYKVHSDGYVYVLGYFNNDKAVFRSKDLLSWEQVTLAPNRAHSIALLGNTLYIGTHDSELYKAEINPLITDTTPPTATLIAPASGYVVSTKNEFAVNTTDASSISKVEFYLGSTLIGYTTGKAKDTSGCMSIGGSTSCWTEGTNFPGSYTIKWGGYGVAAGTYPLKAIAYDLYGNSRETASVSITVPAGLYPPDTQNPVITVSSPSSTQRVRRSLTISSTATDNDQVVYMEAQLDGVTVATAPSGVLGKIVSSIPRGSHTLVIIAKDRAGNTAETTMTFTSR